MTDEPLFISMLRHLTFSKQKIGKVLGKFVCAVKGCHVHSIAYFRCPMDSVAPSITSFDPFTGRVHISKSIRLGFIHYGLVSKCERCGEIVDIDKETTDIPIQYPDGDIQIKSSGRLNERKSIIQKHS